MCVCEGVCEGVRKCVCGCVKVVRMCVCVRVLGLRG